MAFESIKNFFIGDDQYLVLFDESSFTILAESCGNSQSFDTHISIEHIRLDRMEIRKVLGDRFEPRDVFGLFAQNFDNACQILTASRMTVLEQLKGMYLMNDIPEDFIESLVVEAIKHEMIRLNPSMSETIPAIRTVIESQAAMVNGAGLETQLLYVASITGTRKLIDSLKSLTSLAPSSQSP